MKKSFLIIILICFCFIFAGCNEHPTVGLVNNSDGTILEYYSIPFPEEEMKQLIAQNERSKIIDAKNKIKKKYDTIFQQYINSYQGYVESSEFSLEEKTELIQGVTFETNLKESNEVINIQIEYIRYVLNFKNSKCYKIFKNIDPDFNKDKQIVVEKTLFTTTTKVIVPLFNKISPLKQELLTAEELMQNSLGIDNWTIIKNGINGYAEGIKYFNYMYVVPTARLHSNADEIVQEGNYYYHIWQIDINNIKENNESISKMEYWTTTANRVTWYLIALALSVTTIAVIYIVGKRKEKSEN